MLRMVGCVFPKLVAVGALYVTPPQVSVVPSVVAPVVEKLPLQVKPVDDKAAQVVMPVTERVDDIATALPKLNPPVAVNAIRLLFMVTRIRAALFSPGRVKSI
jgi:hypothetical protein